jgi:ATP-dependent helicase HrpB
LISVLPIEAVLEEIREALRSAGAAVIHAPPGAGKTTVVPPALLGENWLGGRSIVMLEPRRLAARAAAHRMAHLRAESVGRTVGYRTRLDTQVSRATRIEVVTEGVLTRMVQQDPTLDGYGLVIFDEFHERSLQGDTGLALVLHTRRLVRPDLRVLVMSATIDGTAVARLLDDAPVVTSSGQQYAVETRYRPPASTRRHAGFDAAFVATAIDNALIETSGDVLVFLPGAPEIHRVQRLIDADGGRHAVDVVALHGSLQPGEQDRAIAPAPAGRRKVVLATSIAETSLTIEGVRVVIDSGLSRRSRFSPRTGMSRLETLRVSRASADQRRGRAGRLGPGVCYRLWPEGEDASLQQFAPPEILEGDLAPLALDLVVAGVTDPAELPWLDAPPVAAFAQARELLRELDAVDASGHVTPHGESMSQFGMHPRFSHMILRASAQGLGSLACELAAILGERDPLRSLRDTAGTDLRARIDAIRKPREYPGADAGTLRRVTEQARRWRSRIVSDPVDDASDNPTAIGRVLALAFPDRVARRRPGSLPRFLLRNGSGVTLPEGDPLSQESFLVVGESDGRVPEARIWLAASLGVADVEADFGDQIVDVQDVTWNDAEGVRAFRERRLGALVLSSNVERDPDPALVADAVASGIRRLGLDVFHWSEGAVRLRQRIAFLHAHDPSWPDMSDSVLMSSLLDRLHAMLGQVRSKNALRTLDVSAALLGLLDWEQRRRLDQLAPTHFEAPTGTRLPVDYSDPQAPSVSVRLQEVFGTRDTPRVMGGRVALTLHLLSPAQRPVQVTRDLAGFWRSSYYDVRKDLRARYPKHDWPDDPIAASPTSRARPRRRE